MRELGKNPAAVVAAAGSNQQTQSNQYILPLFDHHRKKLIDEHGLGKETIREAGLYSAKSDTLNFLLSRRDIDSTIDGIVIPYNETYSRVRLTPPMIIDGNQAKYLSPSGSRNHLHIPKPVTAVLSDPTRILFFTEGEFKTLKATQEGFPCIGLGGVWGFRSDGVLLEEFQKIEFKNRGVVIVMDSDAEFNFNVARAGYALALELSKLGAKTRVLPLPEITKETLNG